MADASGPDRPEDARGAPAPGIGALVGDLIDHVRLLFRQEAALLKAEMAAKLKALALNSAAVAVGVVLLASGFFWLVTAGVLGLATVWPAWLAALVVGGVIVLAGALLAFVGLRLLLRLSPAPERTVRTVRSDVEMVREKF